MIASDIRAAEYRAKARQALATAGSSGLIQVRRRQEAAADVWMGLADFEDRRSAYARDMGAGPPARARPAFGLVSPTVPL